jgi:AbrB family looped-hinge helix DNA binding protein
MPNVATTRLSSRGQVVIPEDIRKALNLEKGTRFIVFGEKDAVILKKITPPSLKEFDRLLKKAHEAARKYEVKPSDVDDIVREARSGNE